MKRTIPLRNRRRFLLPTAVAFISNFPEALYPKVEEAAENWQNLRDTYVATYDRVLRVAYWAKVLEINDEVENTLSRKSFKLLEVINDYARFKCALPEDGLKRIQELREFVEKFQTRYPELNELHEYVRKICSSKTAKYFGEPNFEQNLRNLEKDIDFWAEHRLAQKNCRMNADRNLTLIEEFEGAFVDSNEFAQKVEEDYQLARRHVPTFLGLLNTCSYAKCACDYPHHPTSLIGKVFEKEQIELSSIEFKNYREAFARAIVRNRFDFQLFFDSCALARFY